jgi:hypothetical protein
VSVEKVFKCDVGGEFRPRGELTRLGVRTMDDRPEDADNVDVCAEHADRPISEVLAVAADMRGRSGDGG